MTQHPKPPLFGLDTRQEMLSRGLGAPRVSRDEIAMIRAGLRTSHWPPEKDRIARVAAMTRPKRHPWWWHPQIFGPAPTPWRFA